MSQIAENIVAKAIEEINSDPEGIQIENGPDTLLLSSDSSVDSLTLVRLLLEVERLIEEATGEAVVVVDESSFELEQSPFQTVGSLTQHVARLLTK